MEFNQSSQFMPSGNMFYDIESILNPRDRYVQEYATLLKNISSLSELSALPNYQKLQGQSVSQIAQTLKEEFSLTGGFEYQHAIAEGLGPRAQTMTNQDLWEEGATRLNVLNQRINEVKETQTSAQWLQSQHINTHSPNIGQELKPHVMKWATNPVEAIVIAEEVIQAKALTLQNSAHTANPPSQAANTQPISEDVTQTDKGDAHSHKHSLESSLAKFLTSIVSHATGKPVQITTDQAANLVANNPQQFADHSPEHYLHVLMESNGNFEKLNDNAKRYVLLGAVIGAEAEQNGSDLSISQAQKILKNLNIDKAMTLLPGLRDIPTPELMAGFSRVAEHNKKAAVAAGKHSSHIISMDVDAQKTNGSQRA